MGDKEPYPAIVNDAFSYAIEGNIARSHMITEEFSKRWFEKCVEEFKGG